MAKISRKILFKENFIEGEKKEIEFLNLLLKNKGGKGYSSNNYDNIHKHIDVYWNWNDDKVVSFDVKSLKKLNRSDKSFNEDIVWIELQNINGNKGWLYGSEDYVAFEQINEWLIIERKRLINIVENNLASKEILSEKKLFHLYRRKNNKDIITLFPTNLIKENANLIIKKE